MSMNVFFLLLAFCFYLNFKSILIMLSTILIMLISYLWFRDLVRESLYMGSQNLLMQMSLKLGMMFFILSEVFFFMSFFWTFFHFMFFYPGELGFSWPPVHIESLNFMSIPLLNTITLLSSGVTMTIAHMNLLKNYSNFKFYMYLTIVMGLGFSACQFCEYIMMTTLWSDSSYGSIFFMGTGFHGIHVLIGTTFIVIITIRSIMAQLNSLSMAFELCSWYWHFVDVIWIFLFVEFYWLGF